MPVSYMEIDLRAFRHNLRVIRSHLKNVPALAVIKANAYGHGAVECLRAALEEGCVGAAVARVEEGRVVRASGFDCPVYVLGLPLPEEMSVGVNEELILPVDDTTNLEALETAASTLKKMVEVMLPIDTGMNRIGTHAKDLSAFLEKLKRYPHLHIHGLFTHLATADAKNKSKAYKQLAEFEEALSVMPSLENLVISAASSAGVVDIPESWYNLVRPGIIQYGPSPSNTMLNYLDLKYMMTVVSHITHVQVVHKGETVGYGATYTAGKDMRIATIPIGYADGYPRALSNKGAVLIGEKRCPIVGRICMDQLMAAVDDAVMPGDEVVLIGKQGEEEIKVDELAELAGTIHYEILCGLRRIPRIFIDEK